MWVLGLNPGPLQEQVLLTPEPSLSLCVNVFINTLLSSEEDWVSLIQSIYTHEGGHPIFVLAHIACFKYVRPEDDV